ncbi:hypothetical protein SAMN05421823_104509 [Catalinimonas alkaloidigena]|uniref:AAA domain-containing protein n=1 Tax=Catalinimonas alkaloidigena TaxID=1075417 RepID=A0A1G9HQU6_9BACT|nr:hypothetical protein [Catalinimonas alkaloidigena]SDL15299.1 hypothetical protein SAMN05421823_104509 [Catalinimonas alkaloidigena]
MAKTILIKKLYRDLAEGGREELDFQRGVNLIIGSPNTGKTVWLKMLDYLLGDTGGPETAIDEELVTKYIAIGALLEISDEYIELERRWDKGPKTKIKVGDTLLDSEGFSTFLLSKLEIPSINYPKGNPFAERSWPTLSWRELLRHIYRQERFWSGIAPQQPEATIHAALTLFLGLAEKIFSPLLGELISKRSELFKLKARKEQFIETINQIASDLMSEEDRDENLNVLTLEGRILGLEQRVEDLLIKRESVLNSSNPDEYDEALSNLVNQRSTLLTSLERIQGQKKVLIKRLDEIQSLVTAVGRERTQLNRVLVAGNAFADLKITHCPACDQKIPSWSNLSDECFLCHQHLNSDSASNRIQYELDQLEQEQNELVELRKNLAAEITEQERVETSTKERLDMVLRDLRPAQNRVSAIITTEVSRLDAERGRIEERIRQLERFKTILNYRDDLNTSIDALEKEIQHLESRYSELESDISFEGASSSIEDSMNHYINLLNQGINKYGISERFRWNHGGISLDINERISRFRVKNQNWTVKLGATVQVHFLLAYHYALLRLSLEEGRNYPGIVILDFPPNLLDSDTIGDKENYLIDPFVELCKKSELPLQVIVAGRAFEGLEASAIIQLDLVWP